MVQAILDGRKLQTRRSLSDKLIINVEPDRYRYIGYDDDRDGGIFEDLFPEITPWISPIKSPYGKPGDILWVREKFTLWPKKGVVKNDTYAFYDQVVDPDNKSVWKWKPSIHMPKAAARIWLEVTEVRVERLQDIDWREALKEGVEINSMWPLCIGEAYRAFQSLWRSIKGLDSWELNPWVWVVSFKVLSVTEKPTTP